MRLNGPWIGAFLLGIACWVGWQAISLVRYASLPYDPNSKKTAIIQVQKGISRKQLADHLVQEGIIRSPENFIKIGRYTRSWSKLKAGEYEFSPAMSPLSIFTVLKSGISVSFPVTIKEGDNIYQIAETLKAKELGSPQRFIALCKDSRFIQTLSLGAPSPPTLEGYLFPETYLFPRHVTSDEIIQAMVGRFKAEWKPEFAQATKRSGFSRHQIITLASIIEKETGAPEERPLISSAFHNRLRKGMRLESDPTTIYGIWERYHGNLHKKDLLEKTAYNTYAIPALPPGPIANPGREAIHAALHPATSDFLFFVSKNDGTHRFTSNYKDHSQAVRELQINPAAREGKSWRDLSHGKRVN